MDKTIRKRPCEESCQDNDDIPQYKKIDFEQYLIYDVVRKIFTYLNAKDLCNSSMVCKSWYEVANNIKKNRGYYCSKIEFVDLMHAHTELCNNTTVRPRLALFFSSPLRIDFRTERLYKNIPLNSDFITIGCCGYILDKLEVERSKQSVVGLFLPEIPNVKIETFIFRQRSDKGPPNCVKKHIVVLKKFFNDPSIPDNSSKSLILISKTSSERGSITALNLLENFKNVGERVSIWGGIAQDLTVCTYRNGKPFFNKQDSSCIGIGFAGPGIKTWSIILDDKCNTKERVEKRLKSFRNHVHLNKYSVGFMAACCARGENMFGETGVESAIFKKIFPEVLLVGFFGDGEFGKTTIPIESGRKSSTKYYNTMSTIFLIITYGLVD